MLKRFMNKKLNAMVQHTCLGPEKKQLYLTLPYCGNSSTKLHNLRNQSLRLTPERKLDYFLQKYNFVMTK